MPGNFYLYGATLSKDPRFFPNGNLTYKRDDLASDHL